MFRRLQWAWLASWERSIRAFAVAFAEVWKDSERRVRWFIREKSEERLQEGTWEWRADWDADRD